MRLIPWLFLAAFIFCLTYSPKHNPSVAQATVPAVPCCSNEKHMAANPVQCQSGHYTGIQFGNTDYGCPKRHPQVNQGAIIGR